MIQKQKIVLLLVTFLVLAGAGYGGYWYWNFQKIENVSFIVMKGGATEFLMNVIKAEKIDQKNRINITLKVAPSPPEGERMFFAREGADVAPIGPVTIAQQKLAGKQVGIIGPYLLNSTSVLVKKGSPYQSISDLKGKKLGTRTKTTALYQSLAIALNKIGINLDTDFSLVFPASFAESGEYLKRGDIDAVAVGEIEISKLLATGEYRELLSLRDLWKNLTGEQFSLVYTVVFQDWLDAHPRAAKRLVKTVIDGAGYIKSNPEVVTTYKDLWGAKTDEEVKLFQKRIPDIYPDSWDNKDIEHIKSILKTAVDLKILPELPKGDVVVELK